MTQPLVAVSSDIREFDNYVWHCAPQTYLAAAMDVAGVLPLAVPAMGANIDAAALLARMDGLLVTGSRTNVHPGHYGVEASERHEPFDPARTLFIDDNPRVLESAREFGIRHLLGIKQPDSQRPEKELQEFIALDRFAQLLPADLPGQHSPS